MRAFPNRRYLFLPFAILCMGIFFFGCATKGEIQSVDQKAGQAQLTAEQALEVSKRVVDDSAEHSAIAAANAQKSKESADKAERAAVRAENAAKSAELAADRAEKAAARCEELYRRIMSK